MVTLCWSLSARQESHAELESAHYDQSEQLAAAGHDLAVLQTKWKEATKLCPDVLDCVANHRRSKTAFEAVDSLCRQGARRNSKFLTLVLPSPPQLICAVF